MRLSLFCRKLMSQIHWFIRFLKKRNKDKTETSFKSGVLLLLSDKVADLQVERLKEGGVKFVCRALIYTYLNTTY